VEDLFQEGQGKILALGDLVQGHRLTVTVMGQIEEGLHGVAAAGGNFHLKKSFLPSKNIEFLTVFVNL
jgi:hypothetical protein